MGFGAQESDGRTGGADVRSKSAKRRDGAGEKGKGKNGAMKVSLQVYNNE